MLEEQDEENAQLIGSMGGGEMNLGMKSDPTLSPSSSSSDLPEKAAASAGLCACFTIAYYRPFFDLNTNDVRDRLLATILFFKNAEDETFLQTVAEKPDAYGPFWTATTLIFIISATSNITRYLNKGFSYDFSLVTFCVSLVYGYLLAVTLALWLGCKYMVEKPLPYMSLVCLVGYSFFIYIPCTMLATLSFLSWPALAVGLVASTLFVLKSLVPMLTERKEKAMPVLMLYVLGQLIFMLILKFKFYGH